MTLQPKGNVRIKWKYGQDGKWSKWYKLTEHEDGWFK